MKNAAHQYEDKLLEFAYGELARPEADAVEAHVRGCAKCSQQLAEIKGVRATMSALPMVAAPDAGLESLMAFAEQAARRNAEGQVKPSFWKRYLAPLMTVMALAVVGVIGMQAKDEFDTNPASVAADARLEKAKEQQEVAAKQAEADGKKAAEPAPVAAVAPVAQPAPEPIEEEAQKKLGDLLPEKPEPKPALAKKSMGKVGLEDLVGPGDVDANKKLGGKLDTSQAAPVPESVTRRSKAKQALADPSSLAEGQAGAGEALREDYGNARGAYVQSKDTAAPKNNAPAEAPAQVWAPPPPPSAAEKSEKVSFGLGTSAPGTSSLGATGGAPAATAEPKAAPAKEEAKRDAPSTADDFDKTYGPTTPRQVTKTAPAPAPAAPSSAPPPSKKSSYTLSPMASSSGSGRSMEDEAVKVQRNEARAGLDDDSKLVMQQRAEFRSNALESMREASNRGDRAQEVELGMKILKMGATGAERAEALKRVCDAYDAMGEPESADPYCRQLVKEFPGTTAAKLVTDRRSAQRAAPAKKPAATDRERKAYDAESDQKKPADAASSY